MKAHINFGTPKNQRLVTIIAAAATVLLIPFIAMFFTAGVNWTAFDFVLAAFLLFGTGLICEAVMRKFRNRTQRLIICGVILLILFLLWAELAVGIFGSPIAGS